MWATYSQEGAQPPGHLQIYRRGRGELYLVIALKMLLCHWHCVATVVKLSALDYQKVHCSIYDLLAGQKSPVWSIRSMKSYNP